MVQVADAVFLRLNTDHRILSRYTEDEREAGALALEGVGAKAILRHLAREVDQATTEIVALMLAAMHDRRNKGRGA
jgi:hypothetical protein